MDEASKAVYKNDGLEKFSYDSNFVVVTRRVVDLRTYERDWHRVEQRREYIKMRTKINKIQDGHKVMHTRVVQKKLFFQI